MDRAIRSRTREQLVVGDCAFEDASIERVIPVFQVVPCRGPWQFIVVRTGILRELPYGSGRFVQMEYDTCKPEDGSSAANSWRAPLPQEWFAGDRLILWVATRDMLDMPRIGACYRANGLVAAEANRFEYYGVPCFQPHNFEFLLGARDGREHFEDSIPSNARRECEAAVPGYFGGRPRDIEIRIFGPTEATWAYGDRTIRCYASRADAPVLTVPLKDSLRPRP